MPSHSNEIATKSGVQRTAVPYTVDECNAYINIKRNAAIYAGVAFRGKVIETDEVSQANISSMALAAVNAKAQGAAVGDFKWAYGDADFGWIASDNTIITLDADGMIELGQSVMRHKSALIYKARAVKNAVAAMSEAERGAADLDALLA